MTVLIDIQKSEFLFDVKSIDVFQSCVVNSPDEIDPTNPSDPDPEEPLVENWVPLPPGLEVVNLPIIPAIIDTSPSQMIGCISSVGDNPQGRLAALFPLAVDGDGVVERETNDIWTFDGSLWNNVGPTPGPTLSVDGVIPPWHETIPINIKNRCRVQVGMFPYSFNLLSEPNPLVSYVFAEAALSFPVLGSLGLASPVPEVKVTGQIKIPVFNVLLTGPEPVINPGASVSTPAAGLSVSGLTPLGVNLSTVFVTPGPVDFLAIAEQPVISVGSLVGVESAIFSVLAHIPTVRDPYYDNVVLLLHMEGRDGSQQTSDRSPSRLPDSTFDFFLGKPRISTYRKKFGDSSLYFLPDIVDPSTFDIQPGVITLGSQDFAIEFFCYPARATGLDQYIFSDYAVNAGDTDKSWALKIDNSNHLIALASSDGVTITSLDGGIIPFNEWSHVAYVRSGNTLKLFLNGSFVSSVSFVGSFLSTGRYPTFGGSLDGGQNPFFGYIDEVRVTVGVPRYEAAFSVPANPFWDYTAIPPRIEIPVIANLGLDAQLARLATGATVFTGQSGISVGVNIPIVRMEKIIEIQSPITFSLTASNPAIGGFVAEIPANAFTVQALETAGVGNDVFIATNSGLIELAAASVSIVSGASVAPPIAGVSLAGPEPELFRNQIAYTIPGTYSFEIPSYTTSVCVVAIGGGGGSAGSPGTSTFAGGGGGGGALAYVNNISVTSGETLTVVVGAGGAGGATTTSPGSDGGNSALLRGTTYLCHAEGGGGGKRDGTRTDYALPLITDAVNSGDYPGEGGRGGSGLSNSGGGGGGGAGGYLGYGGDGDQGITGFGGDGWIDGAGGGGPQVAAGAPNNGGGGVGIFGSGSPGLGGGIDSPGGGGSGGSSGQTNGVGGLYGGGAGGPEDDTARVGSDGGGGAVRIIWGAGRAFPSTNTQDI